MRSREEILNHVREWTKEFPEEKFPFSSVLEVLLDIREQNEQVIKLLDEIKFVARF